MLLHGSCDCRTIFTYMSSFTANRFFCAAAKPAQILTCSASDALMLIAELEQLFTLVP